MTEEQKPFHQDADTDEAVLSEWAIRQMVEDCNGTLRTKSTARRAG